MIALVHSPLVGPSTWTRVADELRMHDPAREVVVPDLRPAIAAGSPFFERLVSVVAGACTAAADTGAASDEPTTSIQLVGHSQGGHLLPAIAAAIGRRVDTLVWVDSALPRPGLSWFDQAAAARAAQRRALAIDGLLPPWHEWFGPDAMSALVPDATVRADFEAEIPRLPLDYFGESRPTTEWRGPAGYLHLSEAYDAEASEARSLGWTVVDLPTNHLAPLANPVEVAAAIEELITRLLAAP